MPIGPGPDIIRNDWITIVALLETSIASYNVEIEELMDDNSDASHVESLRDSQAALAHKLRVNYIDF